MTHRCQAGEEQGGGPVGLSALEGEEGSPDPRQNWELSYLAGGGHRWHVAKDGRRVVSNGRERGNKTLHISFADNANPAMHCFYMHA